MRGDVELSKKLEELQRSVEKLGAKVKSLKGVVDGRLMDKAQKCDHAVFQGESDQLYCQLNADEYGPMPLSHARYCVSECGDYTNG